MSLRVAVLVFVCAFAIVASGCGDDETAGGGSTRPAGATSATGGTGSTDTAKQDCPPSKKQPSFDVALIIGQDLSEAKAIAKQNGYSLRAIWVDGQPKAATMDYVPTRLNVAMRDGEVTQLCSVG